MSIVMRDDLASEQRRRAAVQSDWRYGAVQGASVTMVAVSTYNNASFTLVRPATITKVHYRGENDILSLSARDEITGRTHLFLLSQWAPETKRDAKAFQRARETGKPDVERWRLERFTLASYVEQRWHSGHVCAVLGDDNSVDVQTGGGR